MQNKLNKFDAIKLEEARNVIAEVYDYHFKSRKDLLSVKLKTLLKKINHILEEYGEQE